MLERAFQVVQPEYDVVPRETGGSLQCKGFVAAVVEYLDRFLPWTRLLP